MISRSSGSGLLYDMQTGSTSDFELSVGTLSDNHDGTWDWSHGSGGGWARLKTSVFPTKSKYLVYSEQKRSSTYYIGLVVHATDVLSAVNLAYMFAHVQSQPSGNAWGLYQVNYGTNDRINLQSYSSKIEPGDYQSLSLSIDSSSLRGYLFENSYMTAQGPITGNASTHTSGSAGFMSNNSGSSDTHTIREFLVVADRFLTVTGLDTGQIAKLRDSSGSTLASATESSGTATINCETVKLSDIHDLAVYESDGTTLVEATSGAVDVWPGETWGYTLGTTGEPKSVTVLSAMTEVSGTVTNYGTLSPKDITVNSVLTSVLGSVTTIGGSPLSLAVSSFLQRAVGTVATIGGGVPRSMSIASFLRRYGGDMFWPGPTTYATCEDAESEYSNFVGCGGGMTRLSPSGLLYRTDDGTGSPDLEAGSGPTDFEYYARSGSTSYFPAGTFTGVGTQADPFVHEGEDDRVYDMFLKAAIVNVRSVVMVQADLQLNYNTGHLDGYAGLMTKITGTPPLQSNVFAYRSNTSSNPATPEVYALAERETFANFLGVSSVGSDGFGPWTRFSLATDGNDARSHDFGRDDTLSLGITLLTSGQVGFDYNSGRVVAGTHPGPNLQVRDYFVFTGGYITVQNVVPGVWVKLRDSAENALVEVQATGSVVKLDCVTVDARDIYDIAIYDSGNTTKIVSSDPGLPVWPGETWSTTTGWLSLGDQTGWEECEADLNGDDWIGCG